MLVQSVLHAGSYMVGEYGLALGKAIAENPHAPAAIRRKLSQPTLELFHIEIDRLFDGCVDSGSTLDPFHTQVAQMSQDFFKGD